MNLVETLAKLPGWARSTLFIAVSTALATYVITAWMPSPMAKTMADHIWETKRQTNVLIVICQNTAPTPFDAGRCLSRVYEKVE